jgi:hypothetical protein
MVLEYRPPAPHGAGPVVDPAGRLELALEDTGIPFSRAGTGHWEIVLPWQTRVYGFVVRDVEERVTIQVGSDGTVRLQCPRRETHSAHAIGFAGVLILTVVAGLTAGWSTGPGVAAATLLAGSLWSVYTREMAMEVLHRRLERLLGDLAAAVWPQP